MKPAPLPRPAAAHRLLRVDRERSCYAHHRLEDLPSLLLPPDLVVVNDAATLPASLRVPSRDLELRLARHGATDSDWTAVLFGKGDFRIPTERRPEPVCVRAGERLELEGGVVVEVVRVDPHQPRLVEVRFPFSGAEFFRALYRAGRPIQYAYHGRELELSELQNRFAARPWALEMPSAGHFLSWDLLFRLRARGIGLAHLTHAAGISSTGSADLDRRFPLPERYEIDARLVQAVRTAKSKGGRVIAAGTTVVRALEASHAEHGELVAGMGEARLVLGPGFRPKVVDGVLSGMHERGTSHFALLEAFASAELLRSALASAEHADYLQHEFGDATLVLGS